MALETASFISDLVSTNPVAGDAVSAGDDHIRLIKTTVKATFPNVTGAVTPTHTELNYVDGVTSAIQTQLDAKAPLASPTFTGTPAAPTASPGTNTTQVATTAFVATSYAPLASPTFTGAPSLPTGTTAVTQSANDNSTKLATTAYVDTAVTARLAGDWVLLRSQTASSSAALDFINGSNGVVINSTYDVYLLEFIGLLPATDGAVPWMRTTTNASTFDSTSGHYQTYYNAGTMAETTAIVLGAATNGVGAVGNATNETGFFGSAFVYAPSVAAYLTVETRGVLIDTSGGAWPVAGTGRRLTAADVDGFRIMFSTGNIASGTVNLYARKK